MRSCRREETQWAPDPCNRPYLGKLILFPQKDIAVASLEKFLFVLESLKLWAEGARP